MEHHFNVDIATRYGMLEAVLLNHFLFWIKKNEANNVNEHDGYYWTYNSTKALHALFPYASERKIRNALNHLEDAGLLITGNYNKSAYDRTTWYALTESAISILQNRQMEDVKKENGNVKNVTPIPYNNTDKKTDDNTDILVEQYNTICSSLPKCKKITDGRRKKIRMRLKEFSVDDIMQAFQKAEQSDFLSGRDGKWQACSFDWFFKNDENIAKVLEGKYDNRQSYSRDELELQKAYEEIRRDADGNGFGFGE